MTITEPYEDFLQLSNGRGNEGQIYDIKIQVQDFVAVNHSREGGETTLRKSN